MSPTHSEPNGVAATAASVAPARIAAPIELHEVMREQLDYLIEHAEGGLCDCSTCQRYYRVRGALLEIFGQ